MLKVGNALTFTVCTVLLWGTHLLILRGLENAGKLNFAITASKIAGFFIFIIVAPTLSYLIPYLIASAFQLKLVITGETYEKQPKQKIVDGIIGTLATSYSIWVIYAGTADISKPLPIRSRATHKRNLLLQPSSQKTS